MRSVRAGLAVRLVFRFAVFCAAVFCAAALCLEDSGVEDAWAAPVLPGSSPAPGRLMLRRPGAGQPVPSLPEARRQKPKKKAAPRQSLAFVLPGGGRDEGWSQAQAEGIAYLKKTLGDRIAVAVSENVSDPAAAEAEFRRLAQKGTGMIFGASPAYGAAIRKVAGEFPAVRFMQCDGGALLPNLGTYAPRMDQPEYLAGYTAGLMGFHDVGTVAARNLPGAVRDINAFTLGLRRGLREAGAKHDPDRLNTVLWLEPPAKPAAAKALVERSAGEGRDLIVQMADTTDAARAACAKGLPAVGRGVDLSRFGALCTLTSAVYEWGRVYVGVVRRLLKGTWRSGAIVAGFPAGGVGLAPLSRHVPREVVGKVLALRARLVRSEDPVFAGPVRDSLGRLRITAGRKADAAQLRAMDWFVRGVREDAPAPAKR